MKKVRFSFMPLILTCSFLAGPTLADHLDDPDPTNESDGSLKATSSHVTGKIADEFDQALSDNLVRDSDGVAVDTTEDIVTGLRQGTAFEYQYTNADGQLITQTIDSTSGLGYGEVRHALTLSEQNGGDLQAVLDMREDGLGWGDIAHQQGTTLGAAKKLPLTTGATSGSGETTNTNGVISGSGEPASVKNSQIKSKHHVSASQGKGVVSGAGFEPASVKNSPAKSKHHVSASQGKGVVNGAGFENASLSAAQHKHDGNNSGGAKAGHNVSSGSGIVHGGGSGIVHGGGNAYGPSGGKNNGKATGNKH